MLNNENETSKVYLVFDGEDQNYANGVTDFLRRQGIQTIRYDEQTTSSGIRDNYKKWIEECWYVLMLVSNKWINISDILRGELDTILHYKNVYHMQFPKDDFVFMIAIEPSLVPDAISPVVYFGTVHRLKDEAAWVRLSQKLLTPPQRKGKKQVQTGTGIKDLKVDHIMTKKPKSYGLEDDLATLVWDYERFHFRHFPITDNQGRLINILSLRDILFFETPDPEVLRFLNKEQIHDGSPITIPYEPILIKSLLEETNKKTAPLLVSLQPEDNLDKAIEYLTKRQDLPNGRRFISGICVTDNRNKLTGMITYIDILKKLSQHVPLPSGPIERFATKQVHYIKQKQTLKDAIAAMHSGGFRDLPVIGENSKVIGMISEYEVYKNQHRDYDTDKVPVEIIMKRFTQNWYPRLSSGIEVAIEIFLNYPMVGAVAVTNNEGQLEGIVSYIDILTKIGRD
ncbi:MAG: hypothetical protein DPW16_14210 [Chloroflexi bacterium]|nr:hypothetical protein [Chloroflexota bacterium]